MPLDNSSALLKIGRAKELLDGLDNEVRAWHHTIPYSFSTHINPERTRASIVVRANHEPDIIRWSLIVADIIHNLRCALDHSFWAVLLNEFNRILPAGSEKLTFPLWDAAPNSNQRKTFAPIGVKLFNAIESVQPYHHPFSAYPIHPLAILRDIDNANKHKLLFTVMPSISVVNLKVTGLRKDYQNGGASEYIERAELKDGSEAMAITFDVPHPDMKCECTQCVAIIAIKHPVANRLGQDRDDYAAFIDTLIAEVSRTIDNLIIAAA